MPTDVKVRRVDFDYPTDEMPRYFVDGDIVVSHVVAMLSAMFPDGEEFFVRSVRNVRDQITDDVLKKQVNGFIGQEANHGREHRDFNGHLAELGYPTRGVERFVDRGLRFRERIQSKKANLAVTAALEHYTATLAETLMSDESARDAFVVPEVRSLLLWHALEESEHKAVAFDVYRHVGGGERMRRILMNTTTIGFLLAVVGSVTVSLLKDPYARRHPIQVWRSLRNVRNSPFLSRDVVRKIRDYNRPDFHPDDWDASELLTHWRRELFNEGTEARSAG